jgi:hypothetical protein
MEVARVSMMTYSASRYHGRIDNKWIRRNQMKNNKRLVGTGYHGYNKGMELNRNRQGKYWHHTWQQAFQPGSHRGEYPHFYALQKGTPTSTVLTRSTDASQAVPFYPLRPGHSDLLMSVAPTDPSPTRSRTEAVPSGEHRQSHTWTVTGTICLPSWYQYDKFRILAGKWYNHYLEINNLKAPHELPQIMRFQQAGDDYPGLSNTMIK